MFIDVYKQKYLKYKQKYINIKKLIQKGGNDFFDFDKYFINENNKYISKYFLNNKISKYSLEIIKTYYQYLYYKYYEYLTNTTSEQITIPLYLDDNTKDDSCDYTKIDINSQYKVNYIEQAKYYNRIFIGKLDIIDNLDEILNKDKLLLQKNITDLKQSNFIKHPYLNLDYLLEFIKKSNSYYENKFLINYLLTNFMDKFKENYDIQYMTDGTQIKFNEKILINIIKNINDNGKYKIDENTFLILNNKDLLIQFDEILMLSTSIINYDKNILIDLLLKIYEKHGGKYINYLNIKDIDFFYEYLPKLGFKIVNKDMIDINGNIIDILTSINTPETNEISKNFVNINKKNDKIKKIKRIIDDYIANFDTIYNEIKHIIKNMKKYIDLFKINNNFLDIQDIKNINDIEINKHIKYNKKKFCEILIDKFVNDDKFNDKIIEIDLEYIKFNKNKDTEKDTENNYDIEYHANIIILSKIYINGNKYILGRRIEPHRHSNTYCRNSVRKEIREIFSEVPNFIYIDFYMVSHYGLQVNECININNKYILELLDNVDKNYICEISQLNNIDGFCSTWCAYIVSIILLNKDKSFDKLENYFETFNLPKKSFIDTHIDEYEKLDKTKKEDIEIFKNNFKKFYEIDEYTYSLTGFEYNYLKNLKLYTFILILFNYINSIYNITYNLLEEHDNDNINIFCLNFKYDELDLIIKKNISHKIEFIKSNENDNIIINKLKKINGKHYCTDIIFNNEEFCKCTKICKLIPENITKCKKNSEKTEICLKPLHDLIILSLSEKKEYNKYIELKNKLFPSE